MRSDQRWPEYAQSVAAHGVLSSLSVPLAFQGATIGALNTYARRPRAFSHHDVDLAEEVAAWVAVAVGNPEAATRTSDDLTQLRTVMILTPLSNRPKAFNRAAQDHQRRS